MGGAGSGPEEPASQGSSAINRSRPSTDPARIATPRTDGREKKAASRRRGRYWNGCSWSAGKVAGSSRGRSGMASSPRAIGCPERDSPSTTDHSLGERSDAVETLSTSSSTRFPPSGITVGSARRLALEARSKTGPPHTRRISVLTHSTERRKLWLSSEHAHRTLGCGGRGTQCGAQRGARRRSCAVADELGWRRGQSVSQYVRHMLISLTPRRRRLVGRRWPVDHRDGIQPQGRRPGWHARCSGAREEQQQNGPRRLAFRQRRHDARPRAVLSGGRGHRRERRHRRSGACVVIRNRFFEL